MPEKPRLLVFGEASVPSGNARVTESLLRQLADRWDIHLCASHWIGDSAPPAAYPYAVYRGDVTGPDDPHGLRRYQAFVTHLEPQCVLVIGEIRTVRALLEVHDRLPKWPEMDRPPVVAYVPVRGTHLPDAVYLNDCALVLVPTMWGMQELRHCGYRGPCEVLTPGVDTTLFFPRSRDEARAHFGMEALASSEHWIVGNVHKNHPHQRLDVTVMGFAQWVHAQQLEDQAYLWLQCTDRPLQEHTLDPRRGWRLQQLARDLSIEGNLFIPPPEIAALQGGLADEELSWMYSAWDLNLSTSLGEGWGCSWLEAAACGVPTLAPHWGLVADTPLATSPQMPFCLPLVDPETGTTGALVHPQTVAEHLAQLIGETASRQRLREASLALVQEEHFRWDCVARQMDGYLRATMEERIYEVVTERLVTVK